jgi:hypothetical protein
MSRSHFRDRGNEAWLAAHGLRASRYTMIVYGMQAAFARTREDAYLDTLRSAPNMIRTQSITHTHTRTHTHTHTSTPKSTRQSTLARAHNAAP